MPQTPFKLNGAVLSKLGDAKCLRCQKIFHLLSQVKRGRFMWFNGSLGCTCKWNSRAECWACSPVCFHKPACPHPLSAAALGGRVPWSPLGDQECVAETHPCQLQACHQHVVCLSLTRDKPRSIVSPQLCVPKQAVDGAVGNNGPLGKTEGF